MSRRRPQGPVRLAVDPARCDGIGMCALVARRVVDLDAWGYPVVPAGPLPAQAVAAARAAVAACPRRALLLVPVIPAAQASGEPPVTPSTWAVT